MTVAVTIVCFGSEQFLDSVVSILVPLDLSLFLSPYVSVSFFLFSLSLPLMHTQTRTLSISSANLKANVAILLISEHSNDLFFSEAATGEKNIF